MQQSHVARSSLRRQKRAVWPHVSPTLRRALPPSLEFQRTSALGPHRLPTVKQTILSNTNAAAQIKNVLVFPDFIHRYSGSADADAAEYIEGV